jgi:hypothetical protein
MYISHFGNLKLLQTLLPLLEETSDKHGEARLVTVRISCAMRQLFINVPLPVFL